MSTTKTHLNNPPTGMENFSTGNEVFDDFFQSRYASSEIRKTLINSADKLDYVGQFGQKWKRKVKYLKVTEQGAGCSVKYGLASYIPSDVLEHLLPDVCKLADILESVTEK